MMFDFERFATVSAICGLLLLLVMMVAGICSSVKEANRMEQACLVSGNVVLRNYCVKPGSIVEAK